MRHQQPIHSAAQAPPKADADQDRAYDVVGIVASLGGVLALSRTLAGLQPDFPLPILIVQHVRRDRPSLLPGILAARTRLAVTSAREGDRPLPGHVHVAPPDRHLLVRPDGTLGLADSDPVNFCRPAADVLFRSMAEVHGRRAIAVVLTGRGRDGARGVEAVRRQGGMAIAQDEATAEVGEMPRAAVDIGQADLVLPLDRIPFALEVLAGEAARAGQPAATAPAPAIQGRIPG
ncbi:chemotaxis protein CheB [Arenibaculum pallidiluteum]|uniref:chemotaxis protein CheB n=1 Tax=Arenibaculum pallidiluteum TaxID=2812559 RepID=UPI001A9627D3|nr:chemotaxis protein CheB [Arenibaculum pallidiluteum]